MSTLRIGSYAHDRATHFSVSYFYSMIYTKITSNIPLFRPRCHGFFCSKCTCISGYTYTFSEKVYVISEMNIHFFKALIRSFRRKCTNIGNTSTLSLHRVVPEPGIEPVWCSKQYLDFHSRYHGTK